MNKPALTHLLLFLFVLTSSLYAQKGAQPDAPLFRDPITDGAADPSVFYNPVEKSWWMLYTQRRANVESASVAYCYGNDIGIAYSEDNGKSWRYRGTLALDFERGKNTFWAPEVVLHKDVYHMFVSYIQGVATRWSGRARMAHYTSKNLWDWKYEGFVKLNNEDVIDATLIQTPNGNWRMWYKWNSKSMFADSDDLYTWKSNPKPAIEDQAHEGANAFEFKGSYWMVTDQWAGMGVYKSSDLLNWKKQPNPILAQKSIRPDDGPSGAHGDVVVAGDKAYIFYFTHPGREAHTKDFHNEIGNIPYELRRSSIQVAEFDIVNGELVVKDRDKPFTIYLPKE